MGWLGLVKLTPFVGTSRGWGVRSLGLVELTPLMGTRRGWGVRSLGLVELTPFVGTRRGWGMGSLGLVELTRLESGVTVVVLSNNSGSSKCNSSNSSKLHD